MRMIARILGCPFHLNILDDGASAERSNHIEPDGPWKYLTRQMLLKSQKEEKREIPYRRRLLRKARLRKGILPL